MRNLFNLAGKNFIVTGAASGIGMETALLLHELGAKLLLLDVNEELLNKNFGNIDNAVNISCDLTDFDNLKSVIASSKQNYFEDGFDGLVHCAGIPSVVPLRALTNQAYEKVQKINVQAGLNLAKIFSGRGIYKADRICAIVFISSVYGLVGSSCNAAYAISKAAVIGMTKSLAVELAPKKIRVNCIAPGFIKTNMADKVNLLFDDKYSDKIEAMHLLGWGEALDIANGIAFLLSDASKWTTGAVFNIDGGFTAQ
ncbi:MAG: SDR family oxidoreductase [Synergistaceae bacterium]|nr:SDR family oxidoreductase [Synergistaceae bacterium]MBQ6740430.1 SDR family oxidoreductase [Synergistaceae bacterium]MBQ7570016.1 SDR family oxidoreductase [Synergistaceae bacterium]MBQ9582579.1 SDR family oxidoreductase [Synergistaceae bacterium]MBQ9896467.1 SDR family oxidoreductase [Synergistaceae bacterium]